MIVRTRATLARTVVTALTCVAPACGDDTSEPQLADAGGAATSAERLPCLTTLDLACEPEYPPTYTNIYEKTLRERCIDCHSTEASTFKVERDLASALEAGHRLDSSPHAVVIPGDPACSPLLIRLESLDPAIAMPPRVGRIRAGERCAIARWIADGAPH